MIELESLYGKKVSRPKGDLSFRPSAYAIIVHAEKLLLLKTKSRGKFFVPGGAINVGEKLEEGLIREVMEETNIQIKVEKFLFFREKFFYYDPLGKSWQIFAFFYLCSPVTFDISDKNCESDEETEIPCWIEISDLSSSDFQTFGSDILCAITEIQH